MTKLSAEPAQRTPHHERAEKTPDRSSWNDDDWGAAINRHLVKECVKSGDLPSNTDSSHLGCQMWRFFKRMTFVMSTAEYTEKARAIHLDVHSHFDEDFGKE